MRHIRKADHVHTLSITGLKFSGPIVGKKYLAILLHVSQLI